FGDAAFFSFALTKNFSTLGGGMITVKNPDTANLLKEKINSTPPVKSTKLIPKLGMASAMKIVTNPLVFTFTIYPVLRLGYLGGKDLLHPLFSEKPAPVKEPVSHPPGTGAVLGRSILKRIDEHNEKRKALGQGSWIYSGEQEISACPRFPVIPLLFSRVLSYGQNTGKNLQRSFYDVVLTHHPVI
ncbi:MAG: hypothetical protein J7M18_00940, partial [Candidatus Eremiobacteraeota bacterium]|nr:hypothetical protein [Candidatus Eremiobacteraeota bacterium]